MNVMLRPARADDYATFTRLFAELGIPDPVPSAERFRQALVPQMSVACRGDDVVGYITWRPYGTTAHVVNVVVDPTARGQRIGEQLMEHVRGLARAAGCTRWYLNVKRDNTSAIKLYERVGMRFELESVAMNIKWDKVPTAEVRASLADPAEDVRIAAQFGIPFERLVVVRAYPRTKMVTLRAEDDTITAFASFDPGFPGCVMFCAVRPDLAVPLLAALRPYATAETDFLIVTVEGNRALADAVLALGAGLLFEILRLSGPL